MSELGTLPDVLAGLAPTTGTTCPRCGTRTWSLANGRGRLDYCQSCGTMDLATSEGLSLMSLRDLRLFPAREARDKRADPPREDVWETLGAALALPFWKKR